MQLDLKLYIGKYKRITDPQLRGADYKSAPAACFEQRICISGGAGQHQLLRTRCMQIRRSRVVIIPSDTSLGFDKLEILYMGPAQGKWRAVNAGDVIGQSVNLQSLGYPSNVGPHIHLQLKLNRTPIDPTSYFIFK